ncbi:UDP-N-acetylmuramyl peptide synthase [Legionella feeleii]|uniref:UDP-N-acetylmuramyl tripeptide synthase n=1 Tax=Legionella feeleii TaxID=453 RepID=A0A0W0TMY2_9GAMM|nr:UDP-N-acetylmuramyl peptide synthase [Legionella feeleii]KTC96958.1 UDP-N-acetylmuramyl tripeptide synthase [Legionella feeleii]SPX61567.1 UDP-N-acetylmuramyl tripeptide synthase [Legionella feeleii]
MNKNARYYYEAALELLLPVEETPEIDGFTLKLGKKNYFFYGSATPINDSGSMLVARNKYCMNKTLERAGLPVPKSDFVHVSEYLQEKMEKKIAPLSYPLVVKPQEGKLGRGVLCNIKTLAQLKNYMSKGFLSDDYLLVEEFHGNLNSYRVLVLNGRVLAVIQRYPSHIIGDGVHTVQQLIELTNIERTQISDAYGPITVDEECLIRLDELGITLDYIPFAGEWLTLGYTCNATRGGTYTSLGNKICKENRRLMATAAKALSLELVGFDIQCADINRPIQSTAGVIIEANAVGPSIRIHESPVSGIPVKVSKKIIRRLIYRHPLSYLAALYKNPRSGVYLRALILVAICGLGYYGFIGF